MFHKEGHTIILIFLTAVIGDILLLEYFLDDGFLKIFLQVLSLSILVLILQFFRNPKRKRTPTSSLFKWFLKKSISVLPLVDENDSYQLAL